MPHTPACQSDWNMEIKKEQLTQVGFSFCGLLISQTLNFCRSGFEYLYIITFDKKKLRLYLNVIQDRQKEAV